MLRLVQLNIPNSVFSHSLFLVEPWSNGRVEAGHLLLTANTPQQLDLILSLILSIVCPEALGDESLLKAAPEASDFHMMRGAGS